jgi:hypothetical protein
VASVRVSVIGKMPEAIGLALTRSVSGSWCSDHAVCVTYRSCKSWILGDDDKLDECS